MPDASDVLPVVIEGTLDDIGSYHRTFTGTWKQAGVRSPVRDGARVIGSACAMSPAVALLLVSGVRCASTARGSPRHPRTPPGGEARRRATPTARCGFDRAPGSRGYWGQASVSSLIEKGVHVPMNAQGLLANVADAPRVAPFQPWALALYQYRQRNGLADDPTRACLSPRPGRGTCTRPADFGSFRIQLQSNVRPVRRRQSQLAS